MKKKLSHCKNSPKI